ncbi:hypothetical protein SAMN04488032_10238 [Pacificibacter marinus]|uniref:Uncharacterized protein n=1 Tax=Pacificibacter marinus TaxID=658057 RepID=A0A1Y5RXA6_9RHOB|nr:hypothetical protein SAMN04488032_10238 [Pacificibacter marinus]SLN27346.1 hypothetical protein PAM7971_01050 [Pacificibacter marinus]
MGQALPIAVAEKNAARLLDMPTSVFLDLVNKVALPRPMQTQRLAHRTNRTFSCGESILEQR